MKKYSDFSERRRILSVLFDGAVKIRDLLRCACLPLDESFLSGGEFFEAAALKIRQGSLPRNSVEEISRRYPALRSTDKEFIMRFANGLGATDCDGQLSNLEIFINDIKKALAESEAELCVKGRLYIKGSMLTAAAVVLLLM